MQTKEKKCSDLVENNYNYIFDKFKEAYEYLNQDKELRKPNDELEHFEDFTQFICEYGLCFDKVEPNTFQNQKLGYWRWQLSWGGPSDEFRIYLDEDKNIYKIEYWYLDWGDGASIIVEDSLIYHIIEEYFINNIY